MFRTKICGITTPNDARAVGEAGADAIGLNFYPPSPRSVTVDAARAIRDAASDLQVVGVYVNAAVAEITRAVSELSLSAVQLHGDEPPELLADLPELPVVVARRMDERGVGPIVDHLAACAAAGRSPDAVLIDAAAPGAYGGTGKTADWALLSRNRDQLGDLPLILAGGLKPENVADGIRAVGPHGVDTASGVESAPGLKSAERVRAFVTAATAAFAEIG